MRDDDRLDDKDDAAPAMSRSDEEASTEPASGGTRVITARRTEQVDRLVSGARTGMDELRRASAAGMDELRRAPAAAITWLRGLKLRTWPQWRASLQRPRTASRSVAIGLLCMLGLIVFTQSRGVTANPRPAVDPIAAQPSLVQRAESERAASRSEKRAEASPATPAGPATGSPDLVAATEQPSPSQPAPPAEPAAPAPPAPPAEPAPPAPPAPPVDPGPVAGLSEVQMDNAKAIVRTGHDMGMPRRGLIIGVATAMQESNLLNLANDALPESLNHPNQGTGWDHDSVGLFQQRPASGWGPVDQLMDPAYATAQFFNVLRQVPGWEQMPLTDAAQAVQVSAFPDLYAQHEDAATQVVDAIIPPDQ
jgi:hypothetical protein